MTLRFHAALAAIAALCLPLAAPVCAQDREPVQVRVQTSDLNLGSAAGVRSLQTRIRGAVSRSCASNLSGLAAAIDTARCRHEMQADASAKMTALLERPSVQVASAR